jgi:hypothetical protein
MATNWQALNQQFLNERARTGISVKEWCKKKNINLATARRHIKPIQLVSKKYHAKKIKNAQKIGITNSNKQINHILNDKSSCPSVNITEYVKPIQKKRIASLANQNARKFGHYSEFITTDEDVVRYTSASSTKLNDELKLMRMQLSNLMVALKEVETDLTIEQKIELHRSYEKYQTAASLKVARIESLEMTIIRNKKTKVDIEKTILLTEKTRLEIEKLHNEANGNKSPLQDIYDEILAMGDDGMMNKFS